MKTVIVFYIALVVALLGFGFAGPTAGAPWAVVTGTLGLLATIVATVARIEGESGPTGRRRPRRVRPVGDG